MTFRPLNTENSLGSNFSQVNDMVRQLNNEQQTKIFKGPNQVNALISGKLPNDLGYGIQFSDTSDTPRIIAYIDANNRPIFKISEDGVDVTTATDDQLTFNSAQNVLKVVSTGTVNFTPPNSGSPNYTVTAGRKVGPVVTHNLGFIPVVKCSTQRPSVSFNSGILTELPFLESNASSSVLINAFYSITSTTLSFFMDFGGSWVFNAPPDFVIRYYLLQETAT